MNTKKRRLNNKKIFFISFLTIVFVAVPTITTTYFLIKNNKNQKIQTIFLYDKLETGLLVDNLNWKREREKFFENDEIFFYAVKKHDLNFSNINILVENILKTNPRFNFSKLKDLLKNINMNTLNFYDLFYYQKIASNLNIHLDNNYISKKIDENWNKNNNLLASNPSNNDLDFGFAITYAWLDYLIKTESHYLIAVKNKINESVENFQKFDFESKQLIFLMASKLKIQIDKNSKSIMNFYNNWKSQLETNKHYSINSIFKFKFFLAATNFYFDDENINIKKETIEIINNSNNKEIMNFILNDFDLPLEDLSKNPKYEISRETQQKLIIMSENYISTIDNKFTLEPDVKKTYYSLKILNDKNEKINNQKILNFLSENDKYISRLSSRLDLNKWSEEILYNEKIKKMIGYKKTELEINKMKNIFDQIKNLDLDYGSVFNFLNIMILNDIYYIDKDFLFQIKSMIKSYIELKEDDKKSITIYIYLIDRITNLNLINENILLDSIKWILENNEQLNVFYKNSIYYFLLTLNTIQDKNLKQKIENTIELNKEKIISSENSNEENFFADSLLKFEFDKLSKAKK